MPLETIFLEKRETIENWLKDQWQLTPPPVYGSVDLRNANFKIAPIDMNLFPAGFNNINQRFISNVINAAKKTINQRWSNVKKILIIPESHTRNIRYWSNIHTLQIILQQAGFEVKLGTLNKDIAQQTISLPNEEEIYIELAQRKNNLLIINNEVPDLILLNNDLSDGTPEALVKIDQPIMPPTALGWSQRSKSNHFHHYAQIAKELGDQIALDPWLISPLFRQCNKVDFMQQAGLNCVKTQAEMLFEEIKQKYQAYQIQHQPFLIIKADAGTYGMAVMTVRHLSELDMLNRKQRTKMSTIKGGQTVNSVIIQEGIYTFETWGPEQAVAEPVVYLWGDQPVGGFYRLHKERGIDENLNSPGMRFEPMAFPLSCEEPSDQVAPSDCCNRLYVYGKIAQLSMLAAAREMKEAQ